MPIQNAPEPEATSPSASIDPNARSEDRESHDPKYVDQGDVTMHYGDRGLGGEPHAGLNFSYERQFDGHADRQPPAATISNEPQDHDKTPAKS